MATQFDRYWLHDTLGRDSSAEVFRATMGPNAQTFFFELALKRLLPECQNNRPLADRFLSRAQVATTLRHPNIVSVYEAGCNEHHHYAVLEYIWGYPLATLLELLRKRHLRFPSDLTVGIGLQILRALDFAHTQSILHGCVSPFNIYLSCTGQVKLADFGFKYQEAGSYTPDSLIDAKKYTAYLSPEFLAGKEPSPIDDVWGVATTLYEMLTTASLSEVQPGDKVRRAPVHTINDDVSPVLSKIIQQAQSPSAKKRPQEAAEFYRQLRQYLVQMNHEEIDASALARFVSGIADLPLTLMKSTKS